MCNIHLHLGTASIGVIENVAISSFYIALRSFTSKGNSIIGTAIDL